jgi:hypothetical protein
MVFANKAMASRRNMEAQVQDWIADAGTVPPGNGVEAHLWDGSDEMKEEELIAKMSPTERAAYEEKKLKLRKAMVGCVPPVRGGGGGRSWGGLGGEDQSMGVYGGLGVKLQI